MIKKEKKYRYFLYSQSMEIMRKYAEDKIGKEFILGKVLVDGQYKSFTEISMSAENVSYADSVVVAKGNLDDMDYTLPTSKWKGC